MNAQRPKAIILLSGGLDSSTTFAVAKSRGYEMYALTFRYGQRHQIEIEAAERIAHFFQAAQHKIIDVDLSTFGGSALTAPIDVPKDRCLKEISTDIPITYVPARNIIFLSLALAWAEVVGARNIFIGVNALDYSGYPDCRPEFIEAFEVVANRATAAAAEGRGRFRVQAPILRMTKDEIIRLGMRLGVDYSLTHSCYDPTPEGLACGRCDSCILRRKGFVEAGFADPVRYVET
jgi:7-cyano-7-deazaguanine synthase